MRKSETIEGVIILLVALLFLPIWLTQSGKVQFYPALDSLLRFLQYPLLVLLGFILVRRLRRIIHAIRENKNRPGMF